MRGTVFIVFVFGTWDGFSKIIAISQVSHCQLCHVPANRLLLRKKNRTTGQETCSCPANPQLRRHVRHGRSLACNSGSSGVLSSPCCYLHLIRRPSRRKHLTPQLSAQLCNVPQALIPLCCLHACCHPAASLERHTAFRHTDYVHRRRCCAAPCTSRHFMLRQTS